MTAERMFELIGNTEEDMIADAAEGSERKKQPAWLRWGAAAACLCILAAGAFAAARQLLPSPGGGYLTEVGDPIAPGGSWPEGVDPKMASVAVYPAAEKAEDLLSATITPVSEEEAYGMELLGAYLPERLPEGYRYLHGELYETAMKNGNTYRMLRVEYAVRDEETPEEAPVTVPPVPGDSFHVFVTDFEPRTEEKIYVYRPETETHYTVKYSFRREGNGTFHIQCGDAYIGISPESLDREETQFILDDITEGYYYCP